MTGAPPQESERQIARAEKRSYCGNNLENRVSHTSVTSLRVASADRIPLMKWPRTLRWVLLVRWDFLDFPPAGGPVSPLGFLL